MRLPFACLIAVAALSAPTPAPAVQPPSEVPITDTFTNVLFLNRFQPNVFAIQVLIS